MCSRIHAFDAFPYFMIIFIYVESKPVSLSLPLPSSRTRPPLFNDFYIFYCLLLPGMKCTYNNGRRGAYIHTPWSWLPHYYSWCISLPPVKGLAGFEWAVEKGWIKTMGTVMWQMGTKIRNYPLSLTTPDSMILIYEWRRQESPI